MTTLRYIGARVIRRDAMKPGATIKEIQQIPGQWFKMIRPDLKEIT
jgi:hypothetical protein